MDGGVWWIKQKVRVRRLAASLPSIPNPREKPLIVGETRQDLEKVKKKKKITHAVDVVTSTHPNQLVFPPSDHTILAVAGRIALSPIILDLIFSMPTPVVLPCVLPCSLIASSCSTILVRKSMLCP